MKNRSVFISYLKLLRITSWIKNAFVFVPVIFAKHFFDKEYLSETVLAFAAFCIASSLVMSLTI